MTNPINQIFFLYFLTSLILFPITASCQEYIISYTVQDIFACDIDLDNDQDLVICSANDGTTPDTLYIFYNDGIGNFTEFALNRTNRIYVICGNIDDDSFPDIITGAPDSLVYIKNIGDGTFGEEIGIAPSQGYRWIKYIKDLDGDNMDDLVYTYTSYYKKWGILKNEGELSFTDHIIYDDGIGSNLFPSIGSLNNDNLPDVCLSYLQNGVHYMINNGNFDFDTTLLCATKAPPQICKLDLIPPEDVLLFSNNTNELLLFENLGNGIFVNINILPLIGPVMLTDIADFNNDGYDDYCYAICWWTGCTDSIYISINDQNWSFTEPQMYYVGQMQLFRTESTDLNGDNFTDIIMYGYSPRNAFKILWNDGFGSFNYENPVGIDDKVMMGISSEIIVAPNPFTDRTMISYNLDHESSVQINIYSGLGQLIETVTEIGKPKGNFTYEFDASELNRGLYFCALVINGKPEASLKMIVQ